MKKILTLILGASLFLVGCSNSSRYPSFEDKIITPSNGVYADLGNYMILMDEYKEAPSLDDTISYIESGRNNIQGGCTAAAILNSDGEVIIGRNLDNGVSLYPAFIIPTSFGKYKTMQVRYLLQDQYTYESFKSEGWKDREFINSLPYLCTDGFNEKGFFMEANVREANEGWQSTGTNPGKQRIKVSMLVGMVVQNCATVKEAVEYMNNELDIYSFDYIDSENPTDYAWMVGDATGEYGVIELAFNKIVYLPYQSVHANFYLNPEWTNMDLWGTGYGRYEMALAGLSEIETQEEMFDHIGKAMWKDEALYQDLSYIDSDGVPHFVNDKGEKTIDWRSDYYLSMLYSIWPEDEIKDILDKNQKWMIDDANAETVFYYFKDFFIKNGGKADLLAYYEGDELPLRTKCSAPTTGARYSINCAKKNMIVRFFEREDLTFEFSFK